MNNLTIIFLFIIIILLFWDLKFIRKIYKESQLGNRTLSDEKYFELKYNINLLKAISAIMIFIIGFLGFKTYEGLQKEISIDLNESIIKQNKQIEIIGSKVESLNNTLDTLEIYKNKLENLNKLYYHNLSSITRKISSLNKSKKYNPKIYVVNNLKYEVEKTFGKSRESRISRFYFKDITTIFGDKLPKFSKPPSINTEGNYLDLAIVNVTKTYVDFVYTSFSSKEDKNYFFDIWIASFD